MLRRVMRLIWLVVAGQLSAGASMAETLDAPQWHIRITFPCQSQRGTQTVETANGQIAVTTLMCEIDGMTYFVGISELPSDIIRPVDTESLYVNAITNSAASAKGTLRSVTSFALAKYAGCEAIIEMPSVISRTRLLVVGDQMYQVMFLGPAGAEKSSAANRFLDSFALIDIRGLALSPATE